MTVAQARERQGAVGRPRAASRRKQVRDADRTRANVLAAATVEFAEHGFGGARIERIAKRAGANKQLIYYYFGGKEKLYVAVLDNAYAGIRSAEAALHLAELDPVRGITELAFFTWRYHVENPTLVSLVRTENLHKAKYLKRSRAITRLNPPLIEVMAELLRRGAECGEFREDTDPLDVYLTIAGLAIYYLANHWTLETNFGRPLMKPERLAAWGEHIVDVVLAYLRPARDMRDKTKLRTRTEGSA
jgi:AcrR family transcriptional regulator